MVCDTEILCVTTCIFFDTECLEALCSPVVVNNNTTQISSSSDTSSHNQTINGSSARVGSTPEINIPQPQQPKLGLCDNYFSCNCSALGIALNNVHC